MRLADARSTGPSSGPGSDRPKANRFKNWTPPAERCILSRRVRMRIFRAILTKRVYRVCRVALALVLLSTFAELASGEICPEMRLVLFGGIETVTLVDSAHAAEAHGRLDADDAASDEGAPAESGGMCESCICCCAHLLVVRPFAGTPVAPGVEAQPLASLQTPTSFLPPTYHPPRA